MDFKEGFKREMVRKLLLPGGKGAAELSREIGVTPQTLYNWRDKYGHVSDAMTRRRRSSGLSSGERAKAVLDFARLPQAETGEWLRQRGLQSDDLALWENELLAMTEGNVYKEENRLLRTTNKGLSKDLLKKDKALAELSAIIILQKKMADLFPREEET
jgi:transposase